jgi:hypothetical protein
VPDVALVNTTVTAEPKDYTLTGQQQVLLKAVRATINGSAAATAFVPTLQLLAPDGTVMWESATAASVAAGGSADVSWFPGLGGGTSPSEIDVFGARIEMHATQTVNNATNTDLTYDTVAFDTAGMANLGSDARKLTVVTSGLYLVCCERAWQVNGTNRRLIGLTQNNFYGSGGALIVDDARLAITGGGQTTNGFATLVSCTAGDFLATGANQDSGVNLTTGGGASEYFAAILIGAL